MQYRNKNNFRIDGNCQTSDIIHKCIASTTVHLDKVYQKKAEANFKK